jgi:hypothetical protein
MKEIIFPLIFLILSNIFWGAAPVVTNVHVQQRSGTKLVDINYTLALDSNVTATVGMWFSSDNGANYSIKLDSVTGDVGSGIGSGSKSVVWDAGVDWDDRFTNDGKIRVIARNGDLEPDLNSSFEESNVSSEVLEDVIELISIKFNPDYNNDLVRLGHSFIFKSINLEWPEGATKLSIDSLPVGATFIDGKFTSLVEGRDLNGIKKSNEANEFGGLSYLSADSFFDLPIRPTWALVDENSNIPFSSEKSELPVYFQSGNQFIGIFDFGLVQTNTLDGMATSDLPNIRTSVITRIPFGSTGTGSNPIAFYISVNTDDGISANPTAISEYDRCEIGFNARWHFD